VKQHAKSHIKQKNTKSTRKSKLSKRGTAVLNFWPQKRWKKILLTTLLITLAVLGGVGAYLEYSVYREVTTQTEVLNANGAKTALVNYHPGLTDYAKNVTYTYAEALAANGWRVEITTASPQAPTDLSKYSLLVLGWAIYDFNPAPTITNQIHRIGNLNGINTTVIILGGGLDPLNVKETMSKTVQEANGNLIQIFAVYRSQKDPAILQAQAAQLTP
jgi:hypothetical protein